MQDIPTIPLINEDARDERARDLLNANLNGLRLVLVELAGDQAFLEAWFHNSLHVADILESLDNGVFDPGQVFRIKGGHRLPAGPLAGQIQCTNVAAGSLDGDGEMVSLVLSVAPIGDYSTYSVELLYDPGLIDPYFAELPFKFRPGCFGGDCAPARSPGRARLPAPAIDYLAKDYDSFRHTLITAMMARVPGWQVSSEADLDQVLIDLFAAAADELSDYQDRTLNEAWLATCRKRVSLARHARLMDYHLHQGNQSSTWLALILDPAAPGFDLDEELVAWTGAPGETAEAVHEQIHFATRQTGLEDQDKVWLDPLLNRLTLYTWSDAQPGLAAGATQADLAMPGQMEADQLREWVQDGTVKHLLIEEKLNPLTGLAPGRDPRKRQLLALLAGDQNALGERAAQALLDPLTGTWITRVSWRDQDALHQAYAFLVDCPLWGPVGGVSAFHGNLLPVHQGLPLVAHFHEPGSVLPGDTATERHRHYRRWSLYGEERGVLCDLPEIGQAHAPLAYLPTPPGGEVAPHSTLAVGVEPPGSAEESWDEVISLVHSDSEGEDADHFAVETDELGRSLLRFGNGINGRALPAGAVVHCRYQAGGGAGGNVGADSIKGFQPLANPLDAAILEVWNPFDVTDGRDPEAPEKAVRNAPEAFRARQLRAVTLTDYEQRAQEVPGVARAVARYAWTGSWRTVRVVIDPVGTDQLDPDLALAVAAHLEAVRLIGEDLEIRPPRFVPLAIEIDLCLHPDFWIEDVRWELEQELSAGWTPDGRPGFFHPDAWTFAQALHRSQLAGRLAAVPGVEHVAAIRMRRFNLPPPPNPEPEVLEAAFDEILLAKNDPDHRELGFITLNLGGGRQ